jgi:transposase-like protein
LSRPTKYSPQVAERIARAIRAGATRRAAADFAGIGERTLYTWVNEYQQFRQALKKADAACEIALVGTILDTARGAPARLDEAGRVIEPARPPVWQAAAWWLERMHPESWRQRSSVTYQPVESGAGTSEAEVDARIFEVFGIRAPGDGGGDDGGGQVQ